MEIDLYQEYKNLPVPELVKVARSPWDYLPEAVAAAELVLRERGITQEEIAAEEWNLAQTEMSDALARRRFGDYFEWVKELLPSSAGEGSVLRPWIYLFLLGYALYYVFNIFLIIKAFAFFARCEECRTTGVAYFTICFEAVYLTTTLFMLLKQKPLGWALIFVQAVVMSFLKFSKFFGQYEHNAYFPVLAITYLLPFMIYAGLIIFLLRPFVLEFLQVRPKFRDRTVLVGIVLAIAVTAAV